MNNTCGQCAIDGECEVGHVCAKNGCLHKQLLPFESYDFVLVVFFAIGACLAAGGGSGGGAVFIPLLVFLGHFSAHKAVPISSCGIFGGSVAIYLLTYNKNHPYAQAG